MMKSFLKIEGKNPIYFINIFISIFGQKCREKLGLQSTVSKKMYHAADVRKEHCYKLLKFLEAALIIWGGHQI